MGNPFPSNSAVVTAASPTAQVLRWGAGHGNAGGLSCGQPGDWLQRIEGLCTLDVNVREDDPGAAIPVVAYNAALKLRVQYRGYKAEGDVVVDAQRGLQMTIGAVDVISVDAFFEPAVAGAPLVIGRGQRIDVSAHWSTSRGGPPSPIYTAPAVPVATYVRIPARAARLLALPPVGGTLVGTTAIFAVEPLALADVSETPVSSLEGAQVPIGAGARWVRFAGAAGVVYPVFVLSL